MSFEQFWNDGVKLLHELLSKAQKNGCDRVYVPNWTAFSGYRDNSFPIFEVTANGITCGTIEEEEEIPIDKEDFRRFYDDGWDDYVSPKGRRNQVRDSWPGKSVYLISITKLFKSYLE